MVRIGIKEARARLGKLVDLISSGEQVVLLSRGKEVARLVPPDQGSKRLPSLAHFRKSARVRGMSTSASVVKTRKNER